ncbi:hypothetical protein [Ulvibacterium sp.]|uniref:hypothetical protein n=1 Tax=Ulvibacterium sp. TaxID=2665914 RepID=UPI003CC55A38
MKRTLYILVFLVLWLGCGKADTENTHHPVSYERIPLKSVFSAGDNIEVRFKGNVTDSTHLVLSNTWGSTVLSPTWKDTELTFRFPKAFQQRAGSCHWALVYNGTIYDKGEISIRPNPAKGTLMESYLGPQSIIAGKTDFSMFVTSPTDIYDNPLSDSTEITYNYHYGDIVQSSPVLSRNLIAWKNIHSTEKSGRILVTASCNDSHSKELSTLVNPANPIDFQIAYERTHPYADGNQIITFSTDVIQDEFGNIESDGTLVSFSITNTKGMVLQTAGTTINGVAEARLLHPTEAETWKVTAYITGAAKSNTITLDFEAALKDFKLSLSENGRILKIEEMQSFMGQWIPDGMPITLRLEDENKALFDSKRTTSRLGKAQFTMSEDFYPNGSYTITIEAAGMIKRKNVLLK